MAGTGATGREPPQRIQLPALSAWPGPALEPHGDYEAVDIAEHDLAGQVASSAAFMGCRIERCRLDDLD